MHIEMLREKSYRKLLQAIKAHYFERILVPVGQLQDVQGLVTREHFRTIPESGWRPLYPDTEWGGEWLSLWVKGEFTAGQALDGRTLYLRSRAGGVEQLAFVNAKPCGMFNFNDYVCEIIGAWHNAVYLGTAAPGKHWSIALECYAGHYAPNDSPFSPVEPPDFRHIYRGVDICVMDEAVKALVFDVLMLVQATTCIPEDNFLRHRARRTLDRVLRVLILDPDCCSYETWHHSVEQALLCTATMFVGNGNAIFGRLWVAGHSHMDTAWLWPTSESIRKCARTYANALSLMELDPKYRFLQSSTLHIEWMKEYYPSIFAEIKRRVEEGRYEANGGVYVECDCNLTSGELMIRQFLKGQCFTRENFGYTADCFWLPDTFGYNANMPQIMRGCGIHYFLTTKLRWSELNQFPFSSFLWRGIDGTEVLTHFPVTHGVPDLKTCMEAMQTITDRSCTDMVYYAYGMGDGGGGPTWSAQELVYRMQRLDGTPETVYSSVSDFMKELEKTKSDLPTYSGELYLELHRGTLTQMHDIKRLNRKTEFAMRDMEYFTVLSGCQAHTDADRWCKTLLKNQFHDILPGTCIASVHEQYRAEMTALLNDYKKATQQYATMLVEKTSDTITMFNTLSFDREDVQVIEANYYAAEYPSQLYMDVCGRKMLAVGEVRLPAFGANMFHISDTPLEASSAFEYDGTVLETPFAVITFSDDGFIASYVDKKSGRELRKLGGYPLNVLLIAEDIPEHWDNWDVEFDVLERLKPITGFIGREIITDGAVEFRIRSRYRFGTGSMIVQDLVAYAASARLDFHTMIQWGEKHRLLKAGFDVDVHTSMARSEIQFGYIERPTTQNNSIECAKFEVCNQKWTDVSEPDFGVAILNDCKYGISTNNCNLQLSLHRGGTHPDCSGDAGIHELTYSFFVHSEGFSAKNVVREAYCLNVPATAVEGTTDHIQPLIQIDSENIICEAVKPLESGEQGFCLRLYECEGNRAKTTISIGEVHGSVWSANMLEEADVQLPVCNGAFNLIFRPFEIKTILIKTDSRT